MTDVSDGKEQDYRSEQNIKPREEDHLRLHFTDIMYQPFIAGVWSDNYAQSVARFVTEQPLKEGAASKRAIAQLVLSPDWITSNDITILNDLHLAEAEARGITPWTLQRVIFMQDNLYNSGFIDGNDLVGSRSQILSRLNGVENPQNEDLPEIGKAVGGLELCIADVLVLERISPEKAKELQNVITEKFGEAYYSAHLLFSMGQSRDDRNLITKADGDIGRIYDQSMKERLDFIGKLPKDIQRKIGMEYIKANNEKLKRSLRETFSEIGERVRGAVFPKSALEK